MYLSINMPFIWFSQEFEISVFLNGQSSILLITKYLCTYEHYCKYWNSYNCQSTCAKWANVAFSSFAEKVYAQKTFANHPSQG